jgi:serine/threonine-protein kinase
MAVRIGQLLDGKYRVVRVLGKGGMGAVYEGENTLISRRVAIKVLHPDLMQKRDIVTRFELEAQAAGRIQNDHINEVLDLGTLEDGSRFIVLEFLEGETLKDRVKRAGRLTPMQAVHVVRQVLVGLSAAHRAGIVHRDLKPGNVFILWEKLGQRDFVKIIDFGVSKFLLSRESEELDATHANTVLGTPHYMAPEQLRRSGGVDARADLYSVGIILYKAVTGRVPYHAHSVRELLVKLTTTAPVPAAHWVAGLEPAFLRILDKAIQRDVDKRFQSSDEFLAELEQWRMEMAASELPYFTEDGLMSTMHNVSLKRGSSSEVSVPPVHVSAPGTDSVSLQELSEVSLESMPSAKSGPSQVQSTGDTAQAIRRPVASSWAPRVAAIVLVIAAMGGVAAGGWYLSRTLRPPVSTAEALVEPSDSSVTPADAVPVASSAIVEPPPAAVEPSPADGEPKEDEPVISVSELPTEPGAPPGPAVRVVPGPPRTNGPVRPGGKKEEPKDEPASEWGY